MKVTLRKSAQILSQINNYKVENQKPMQVVLHKNSTLDAKSTLESVANTFSASVTNILRLNQITANIRNAVSKVNNSVRVTELVGELNAIENSIKFLNPYSKVDSPTNIDSYVTIFNNMVESQTPQEWSYTSGLSVHVITEDTFTLIRKELTALKRRKNIISDELVALNSSNFIEIEESDYTFLESLEIV